jgi:hypothetical protein
MSMKASLSPFRDEVSAIVERADRLARENAVLRARLRVRDFNWLQWLLVGVLVLCAAIITYILSAVRQGTWA